MSDERKLIFCTDAGIPPVVAKKTNGKWILWGISLVKGMGSANHDKHLFNEEYDDLIALCSMKGLAYALYQKNNKWGAIEVRDNKTVACAIKKVSEAKFESPEALLTVLKINRADFR